MFHSQASYTFNPLLPFDPCVSTQHFSFDAVPSFAGDKILQSVADFIAPSNSSSPISKLTSSVRASSPIGHSQEGDRVSALSIDDSLEDTVSRLLGHYRSLYVAMIDTQTRQSRMLSKNLDFSIKAYFLSEISQLKWGMMNLMCRLAALAVKYSWKSLSHNFLRIAAALVSSNSFRNIFQEYKSHNIRELIFTLYNLPMPLENSLYACYLLSSEYHSKIKIVEGARDTELLNIRCPAPKSLTYETSADFMDILRSKKTTSCSEEDAEEDLERHERSSTTSASSRTNSGEVEAPLTGYQNSPHSKKIESVTKDKDLGEMNTWEELYGGCFFGDLMITFSSTDKLLLQDDEEETDNHHSKRKVYHNKSNYSKPPVFNTSDQSYQHFNPKVEENRWKTNSASNEAHVKGPQQEQKIIPLNLFTLPTGAFLPPTGYNVFNPVNITLPPPMHPIIANTFQNKGVMDMQKSKQTDIFYGQKTRDVSRDSQSSFLSDKKKTIPITNPSSRIEAPQKNVDMQSQSYRKGGSAKKQKPQNAKKNQDKGGFKLWDMISVQGKLKNF